MHRTVGGILMLLTHAAARVATEAFAKRAGFTIVAEHYDAAVSGADQVDQRPGFVQMLQRLATNGAKTIIVESPDRFARDLAVQLAGHDMAQRSRHLDHYRIGPRFFH
jgi:DNA invertase Pin-like site-specific DNA recombinase